MRKFFKKFGQLPRKLKETEKNLEKNTIIVDNFVEIL